MTCMTLRARILTASAAALAAVALALVLDQTAFSHDGAVGPFTGFSGGFVLRTPKRIVAHTARLAGDARPSVPAACRSRRCR